MNALPNPVVQQRNEKAQKLRHLQLIVYLAREGYPVVEDRIGGVWCSRVINTSYRQYRRIGEAV